MSEILKFNQEKSRYDKRIAVLDHNPSIIGILGLIRKDVVGGEPFRSNLFNLALTMMGLQQGSGKPSILIDVPRGGSPMTNGIAKYHNFEVPLLRANTGENKDPEKPLLPSRLSGYFSEIVLTDAIVASGKTILDLLAVLDKQIKVKKITVVTAISTPQGMHAILDNFPRTDIITATVEEKCEWVDIDGKKVLFVADVGDVGTLASK